MKYLVTGGAGFIGSALVGRLTRDGHEVIVLDDFSRGRGGRLPAGKVAEIIHGDVRRADVVRYAMQGCDAVLHLAYLQGTQTFYAEPRQVLDVAIRGMLNVLAACEETGCGTLLLVSSSEAYQVAPVTPTPEDVPLVVPDILNPRYSYGGGKIACELMATAWERTGVLDKLIIARPHNIYGPDMGREHVIPEFCLRMNRLFAEFRDEPDVPVAFPIQGSGQETRSFCYISDCVDQLMAALEHATADTTAGTRIYHVGAMEEKTIAEVAHAVASCYGRVIKVVPGKLPKGSPPRRVPDTSKITALAGFSPRVPFAAGLRETVNWYQSHG